MPEKTKSPTSLSEDEKAKVRQLVEIYYDIQDVRIRSFNRLREHGEVEGVNPKHLLALEREIREYIKIEVKDIPIVKKFLKPIRGIGPMLAGGLISFFDPHEAKHASSFWKYAGLHVENGHAVKRKKNEKLDWNPRAKVLMWKVADSFIKQRTTFYRDIYDQAKDKYTKRFLGNGKCERYAECMSKLKKAKVPSCKNHMHYMAMRPMVKRFLADFWAAWRSLEGLPVSKPYAHKDD